MASQVIRRNFRQYDKDDGQPGIIAPTGSVLPPSGRVTLAANRAYYVRFVPSRPMVITKVAFAVHTAASANDNVDVGIYDASRNRLVAAGSTAGKLNAYAAPTVSLSLTLTPGTVYYAALACGTVGGTAAGLAATNPDATTLSLNEQLFGSASPNVMCAQQDTAFPLPSTATFAGTGVVPIIAVRES